MTEPRDPTTDLLIYAATPAGVIAAVSAARQGLSVTILEPTRHVGGLNASGLNTAERENMGNESFGGIMLEFYRRLGRHYGLESPLFRWESKVAEATFEAMLEEADITVCFETRIHTVVVQERHIRRVTSSEGRAFSARYFIDASYEGDLMARAGISYTWGREGREAHGEALAGQRFIDDPGDVAAYGGKVVIDEPIPGRPYTPDGKLRPFFTPMDEIDIGKGDYKVMNYHFRINVSTAADRIPIEKPPGYDPERFAVLREYLAQRPDTQFRQLIDVYPFPSGRYTVEDDGRTVPHPGEKWELNNKQSAIISLGHFGGQFDYPDADEARRAEIVADHREHNQGLLYFLAHDKAVPATLQAEAQQYGLPADEFADNGHWPYQLYVREARRMIGQYVMTEHDVLDSRRKDDVVWLGTHKIDCHHVQRVAVSRTHFRNEGRIWRLNNGPFDIPYRILLPKRSECENLLVPVCVSATHVAFCTLRLESMWMAMGQVAGTAAAIAATGNEAAQDIAISRLQQQLQATGSEPASTKHPR